jgi:hypothetical protein
MRSALLSVAVAALLMDHVAQPAVAEVLHWEVTGRVAEVSDPDAIFGNVLVNDPVRGYFCYDTSLEPDLFFGLAFYMGEFSPTGPVMVVDNPRDQSELEIRLPVAGGEPIYVVGNDFDDPDRNETNDFVSVEYLAEPPPGYQGTDPIVIFSFVGEDPIDDFALPTDLDLQDWLMAEIVFSDASADDVLHYGEILAEIQTIRLVEPVGNPGDFDGDGDVDGQDFLCWQRGDSLHPFDAADLADWRAYFGVGQISSGASSSTIPEPAAWILLALGTTAAMFRGFVVAPRRTDLRGPTGDGGRQIDHVGETTRYNRHPSIPIEKSLRV